MGQLSTLSILEGKCDIIFHVLCTSKRRKGDAGFSQKRLLSRAIRIRSARYYEDLASHCHLPQKSLEKCMLANAYARDETVNHMLSTFPVMLLARVLGLPSFQRFCISSTQVCILILKIFVKFNWLVQDYSMSLHQWPMLGLY